MARPQRSYFVIIFYESDFGCMNGKGLHNGIRYALPGISIGCYNSPCFKKSFPFLDVLCNVKLPTERNKEFFAVISGDFHKTLSRSVLLLAHCRHKEVPTAISYPASDDILLPLTHNEILPPQNLPDSLFVFFHIYIINKDLPLARSIGEDARNIR